MAPIGCNKYVCTRTIKLVRNSCKINVTIPQFFCQTVDHACKNYSYTHYAKMQCLWKPSLQKHTTCRNLVCGNNILPKPGLQKCTSYGNLVRGTHCLQKPSLRKIIYCRNPICRNSRDVRLNLEKYGLPSSRDATSSDVDILCLLHILMLNETH